MTSTSIWSGQRIRGARSILSELYLFDTNFVSELRKPKPQSSVIAFHQDVDDAAMYVSVMTLGELRRGAELKFRNDATGGQALGRWVASVEASFGDRIVPVDREVADVWGRLMAQRSRPVVDTLIAATAIVHGMTLVTRNVRDVQDTGVRLVDPWTAG